MRLPWTADRYVELEEAPAVLTPLHPTTVLLPEHFSTPLPQLRFPVKLDFSHERFRLRSLSLLSQLKDTALQEIDLSDNELQSLTELNRCSALKTLCARRNSLASGAGVLLTVHRLTRLDLSDNRLTELPPLKELTNLQVGGASTPATIPAPVVEGPGPRNPGLTHARHPFTRLSRPRCLTSVATASARAGVRSFTVSAFRRWTPPKISLTGMR